MSIYMLLKYINFFKLIKKRYKNKDCTIKKEIIKKMKNNKNRKNLKIKKISFKKEIKEDL